MHHLGIATTRALSLVVTGDTVVRDMLYDGNPQAEPGAVVCRVAPSFTRFGTFELPAARRDEALLRRLVAFTLRTDFPALASAGPLAGPEMVARWFGEICERTARLLVDWMRVGFVHGVLNTDNMSVLGLTIDYGPYGWLERYDPTWTPNTTDAETRRYRYEAQPDIAHWNLLQLGRALLPLTGRPEPLREGLDRYAQVYARLSQEMMAARLGWGAWRDDDGALVSALFETLTRTETDQVIFYRELARVPIDAVPDDALLAPLGAAWYRPDEVTGDVRDAWVAWLRAWGQRVQAGGLSDDERRRRMDALNPRFVLRNYLAQEAIDAATAGDTSLLMTLMEVLRRPYDDQPGRERFAARRPEWARRRVGCSMLSCSS